MTYTDFKLVFMDSLRDWLALQENEYTLTAELVNKLNRSFDGLIVRQEGKPVALSIDSTRHFPMTNSI